MIDYTTFILAFILPFCTGVLFFPGFIFFVKRLLVVQTVHEKLVAHKSKQHTPTMGGVVLLAVSLIFLAFFRHHFSQIVLPITFALISYSAVGFLDDFVKIKRLKNRGISALSKLMFQCGMACICIYILRSSGSWVTTVCLGKWCCDLGFVYYVFGALFIVSVANSVNLTDGLDLLAVSTSLTSFISLLIVAILQGRHDVAIVILIFIGALLSFVPFNGRPAKLFMGDVGSMLIGAVLATLAIILRAELFMLLFGLIFVFETISVILQLGRLRLFGKRVFRMAPLHHHFECLGMKEVKVVWLFWCIGLVANFMGVLLYILLM